MIPEPFEARIRRTAAAAGLSAGVIDEEQLLRIFDRQCLDQHGVDEREDRRVGADPESERQQGDECERRRPAQEPERVADVAAQFVDESQADGVAAFLPARFDAAELGERTPAGFVLRHTSPAQIRLVELEVGPHFGLHLTFEVSAPGADSKPRPDACDETHVVSLTRLS